MAKLTVLFVWVFWNIWDFLDYLFEDPKKIRRQFRSQEELLQMTEAEQNAWSRWNLKNKKLASHPKPRKKAQ